MRVRHVLHQIRRGLAGAGAARPVPPRPNTPLRLGVEVLEDRAVPAVFGTAGPDTILVEYDRGTGSTKVFVEGSLRETIGPGGSTQVDALSGNDTVIVNGLGPGVFLGIDAGKDDDTILVCPDAQDLGAVQGYLGVGGSAGNDQLLLSDSAWGGGDTYTITAQTIQVAGLPNFMVGYGGLEFVKLTTGAGNDTVRVTSAAPGTAYSADTGSGWDTFQYVVPSGAKWHLTGPNQGFITGWGSFSSAENLVGGDGNDWFFFDNPGASVSGIIDGGGHVFGDELHYQGDFPGAVATIPSGPATATGGVTNIEAWFP